MGGIGANGQKVGQKVKIFVFTLIISQYQHGKTALFITLFAQSDFGPPKMSSTRVVVSPQFSSRTRAHP